MSYKWIGAILIICGCGFVGFSVSAAFRREEQLLRQLIGALDHMSCELQFRMTPLPQLCRQVSTERSGTVSSLFSALSRELELQHCADVKGCLKAAEKLTGPFSPRLHCALDILGSCLGRFDLEGQLQGLEAVRGYCRRELETMAANRDARLRCYQTLGLCAGAAIAILFV